MPSFIIIWRKEVLKIKNVIERIGSKRIVLGLILISVVAFSVIYIAFQPSTGFAILTTPPPGIPGPYYVTAEAKIYGPVVDLAAIKSKMGGEYASDYTYVQWGTNPFYRVYVDNTFQEVYYGQMIDVMDQISWRFSLENNINNTYSSLENTGAIDPTSELGNLNYFGNMPGTYIAIFLEVVASYSVSYLLNMSSSQLYDTEAGGHGDPCTLLLISLNATKVINAELPWVGYDYQRAKFLNATSVQDGMLNWNITLVHTGVWMLNARVSVTIYLKDLLLPVETTLPASSWKVYTVIDSPGTGFVSKYVSPSSPVVGSTVEVTVRLDPPSAGNINITDLYPNTFTWPGGLVTLQKFRIGVGLVATASVSVAPNPVGSNMQFTVYYDQATNVLELLLSDEYVYMSYTLTAPSTSGEYTLPAATMTYLIPLPQL